jgi:hypothetical protein
VDCDGDGGHWDIVECLKRQRWILAGGQSSRHHEQSDELPAPTCLNGWDGR